MKTVLLVGLLVSPLAAQANVGWSFALGYLLGSRKPPPVTYQSDVLQECQNTALQIVKDIDADLVKGKAVEQEVYDSTHELGENCAQYGSTPDQTGTLINAVNASNRRTAAASDAANKWLAQLKGHAADAVKILDTSAGDKNCAAKIRKIVATMDEMHKRDSDLLVKICSIAVNDSVSTVTNTSTMIRAESYCGGSNAAKRDLTAFRACIDQRFGY